MIRYGDAEKMPTRAFGANQNVLPVLSIGTAALGRPAYLTVDHGCDVVDASVDGMRTLAFEVLDFAYASGLRHIDTAFSYGLAEQFVAEWMDRRGMDDIFLTSKWGYSYVGGWQREIFPQEVKNLKLATYASQAPASFQRFGSRLSGYQIHSATVESGVLRDRGVLDAMRALADTGVRIGVSTSGPEQSKVIDIVVAMAAAGSVPFAFVQSTWNVLETSAAQALRRASDAGLGIIIKEALANGVLARGNRIPGHVRAVALRREVSPDAICLAAALALDCNPVVLTGPSTVRHLRDNLEAVSVELSNDELAELSARPMDPHSYWMARSALPWT
ncbi:aldo/keto reductase [Nocardia takedensis]